MVVTTPFRKAVVLTAAAILPFATIWSISAAARWAHSWQAPVETVSLFSDYFDQHAMPKPKLPAARTVWAGPVNVPLPPFWEDLAVVGDHVVVAGRTRLYVIRPRTGELHKEVVLPPRLQGVSAIDALPDHRSVSTYSFDSGLFASVDLEGAGARAVIRVDRGMGQPILLGGRIIGNGGLPNALLRAYDKATAEGAEPIQLAVAQEAGAPLFPGLTKTFSRQLNVTTMTASSEGDKLALAFRWSDRINIHDARTLQLERSIAGPVETKLSFGVVRHEGETIFTLDPEATHSYADIVAAGPALIAAYSGLEKRKAGTRMSLAAALQAFSWDGRLLGEWSLPEPVQRIAFDAKSGTLYALKIRPLALVAIDAEAIKRAITPLSARGSR